jgi:hypothetical protein
VNNDDALMLALQMMTEMQKDIMSVHRDLYQAQQNLAEQERLTEQARSLAASLEAEAAQ